MPLTALKSVVRRWFEGGPRRPIRTRRLHPLHGVERLEDRINPADPVMSQMDVGVLHFVSDTSFTHEGSEYVASSGRVSIGFKPTGSENFLALVQVNLGTAGIGAGELALNMGSGSFGITNGKMALTVVNNAKAAPIWQTPDTVTRVNFPVVTLTGGGVTLPAAKNSTFQVKSADFTLDKLQLVDPVGGNTSDAKVQMQGNVSFDQLPLASALNGLQFAVDDLNYVVADKQGISLTGLKASNSWPLGSTLLGMDVSGGVTIEYTNANAGQPGPTVRLRR